MSEVILHKGGRLVRRHWEGESCSYLEEDVSDSGAGYLYHLCTLAEGVTLHDIFVFIHRNRLILDTVLGPFSAELIEEGLSRESGQNEDTSTWARLDFLELYWDMQEDSDTNAFDGYFFPRFQVWGELLVDAERQGSKGDRLALGLSPESISDLTDLEVRLHASLSIVEAHQSDDPPRTFKEAFYTLGHILYGIVWELTFHGSRKMREEWRSRMRNAMSANNS